jgi:hypothetical protein
MRLKSETKQVIEFLKHKSDTLNRPVLETCKDLKLNYDMVCRALQLLHTYGVINRDSRGPNSAYSYPKQIGLGDVIFAVEGIELSGMGHIQDVVDALNNVKL